MRHSPVAYKHLRQSAKGFYESQRLYPKAGLIETSIKTQAVNAFGLKLVERATFFQDARIPKSVKLNIRNQDGAWVLYLPKHERTVIFVGDNPSSLAALGAAYMNQITGA